METGLNCSNKENMRPDEEVEQSTQVLMGSGYNQKKVPGGDSLLNESAMGATAVN